MGKKYYILISLVLAGGIIFFVSQANTSNRQADAQELEVFASCLADEGAKFYGAFWCSHCNDQKDLFGDSSDSLPYVECSTSDGKGQTSACIVNGINAYPTWEFIDGSRLSGKLSLEQLSQKTGCQPPA